VVVDKSSADSDRTTVLLVVVVLTFVVTELPQGVLAFLSGLDSCAGLTLSADGSSVFDNVYVPLGDVFDLIVLVNSSLNFILYCVMSAQFRATFQRLFLPAAAAAGVRYYDDSYVTAADRRRF